MININNFSLPVLKGRECFYNEYSKSKPETVKKLIDFLRWMDDFNKARESVYSGFLGLAYNFSTGGFDLDRYSSQQGDKDLQNTMYRTHLVAAFNTLCIKLAGENDEKSSDSQAPEESKEAKIKAYFQNKILKKTPYTTLKEFELNANVEQCDLAMKRIQKLANKMDNDSYLNHRQYFITKCLGQMKVVEKEAPKPVPTHPEVDEHFKVCKKDCKAQYAKLSEAAKKTINHTICLETVQERHIAIATKRATAKHYKPTFDRHNLNLDEVKNYCDFGRVPYGEISQDESMEILLKINQECDKSWKLLDKSISEATARVSWDVKTTRKRFIL